MRKACLAVFVVAVAAACDRPASVDSETQQQRAALEQSRVEIDELRRRLAAVEAELSEARERNQALDTNITTLRTLLEEYEAHRRDAAASADSGDSVVAGSDPRAPEGGSPTGDSRLPTQEFRSLKVALMALEPLRDGNFRATLRFENIDASAGLALAHRAENSDGIADFWKFFPRPIGLITDDRGNTYGLSSQSPLGFARDENDWLVMRPGETSTQTILFEKRSGAPPGSVFTISMDLRVVTAPKDVARWSLVFTGIRP